MSLHKPITNTGIYFVTFTCYKWLPLIEKTSCYNLIYKSFTVLKKRGHDIPGYVIWNEGSLPVGLTLAALKRSHSSRPRNPIIADVSFKGGYIDAWGRGTIKILDTCKEAELPEPEMQEQDGGFIITLFKNNLTQEQLTKLGLNDRQVKAVIFVKEKGKITIAVRAYAMQIVSIF